jgi:hypothetical protein
LRRLRGDGGAKLRRLETDRRALAELLKVVGNDERAAAKAALDDPAVAVLWAERYVIDVSRIIGADRVDLLLALKLGNRNLRD